MWLFTGPGNWVRSPFLVSMYTFLIRLGDKCEVMSDFSTTEDLIKRFGAIGRLSAKNGDNDVSYIKSCADKMHLLVKNADILFFNNGTSEVDPIFERDDVSLSSFHNGCGIWSLCRSSSPDEELNRKVRGLKE